MGQARPRWARRVLWSSWECCYRGGPRQDGDPAKARVVLMENGSWARPIRGKIFVRSSPGDSGYEFIDARLAEIPEALAALSLVGVQVLDRAGELRYALARARDPRGVDWAKVWPLARQCTVEVAKSIFLDELPIPVEQHVRVRTMSGEFRPLNEAFFPGPVVSSGARADAPFCIDTRFHESERALVTSLGAVDQPVLRQDAPTEMWLERYHDQIKDNFIESSKGSKPVREARGARGVGPPLAPPGTVTPARPGPGGCHRPRASTRLHRPGARATCDRRSLRDQNVSKSCPPVDPSGGPTSHEFGPLPPGLCLTRDDELPDDVLPTVDVSTETAEQLGVNTEPSELTAPMWGRLLQIAETWIGDPERAFRL